MFLAAFLAAAFSAPAFSAEAGAQLLGLWQDRIGDGVAYGEPTANGVLTVVDPVASLPVSRRPAPRAMTPSSRPAALQSGDPQSSPEAATLPPVGDLMAPRFNPDVPLPHPDLQGYAAPAAKLTRAQPYVRGSDQGAVLGLRVPLSPARGSASSMPTTSSGSLRGLDGGFGR
jgi:hypothetical protein